MINKIYIGLPTLDLNILTDFYKSIGFEFDEMFSSADFSQFKISDSIYLSIFPKKAYMKQMPSANVDPEAFGLVSSAVSLPSKEAVDELVAKALEAGGKKFVDANDSDFMYMSGFVDPDGHVWTVFYMKMQ